MELSYVGVRNIYVHSRNARTTTRCTSISGKATVGKIDCGAWISGLAPRRTELAQLIEKILSSLISTGKILNISRASRIRSAY
jgi:hypothetical protein